MPKPSAETPPNQVNLAPNSADLAAELAPWRTPLSRALHRNRAQPFARYLQLATVRGDGTPANRTIVFRGFRGKTNQLMFIADRRSEKIEQLSDNPHAEACWYFTKTREQFRLTGQVALVTAETEQADLLRDRQQIWQNISAKAKLQFAWPQPKASRTEDNHEAFTPPAPDEQTPPPTFALMLLTVSCVDHLALRGDPQTRYLYQLTGEGLTADCAADSASTAQWQMSSVNP
ncbi:MAG: Npun_F5749 family FMN-dependent PPOX-type flavoprotein [Cyanobacteria bacterium J06634_5]